MIIYDDQRLFCLGTTNKTFPDKNGRVCKNCKLLCYIKLSSCAVITYVLVLSAMNCRDFQKPRFC